MSLAKIFDLLRCSRNNISCNADILTIEDARNKYKNCQYEVVNALDGMPAQLHMYYETNRLEKTKQLEVAI